MQTKPFAPWLMLFSRLILFACVQAIFALGFYLAGSKNAWETSANWWPIIVAIANLVTVVILVRSFRDEGKRYLDIFRFDRHQSQR